MAKSETDNEKDIALMQKDMSYVRKDLTEIKIRLTQVLEHYVQRDEMEAQFSRLQTEIDKRFDGVHDRVSTKLDKEEFAPFKKLFWTMAGTIAIMGLTGGIVASVIYK